jgi:all-trans-retinol 13,14-reductase
MDVGSPYKTHPLDGRYDAIVVGSGMSGLSTAAILARHAGRRVLVLERHYTAGGFTHAFTRPGYEWDVGVHYIGQVGPGGALRGLFDYVTEGRLDWAPLPDVYDRIVLGDREYDYVTGTKRFIRRMTEYFPREASAIARYVALVKEATGAASGFYVDKVLPASLSRVVGPLLRAPLLRHADRTTGEVLASLTDDLELRAVLAGQLGDYGLPPSRSSFAIHAAVASHYLGGAFFPVGGARAIARAIAPVIERAGGAILVRAEVSRILVEGGRAVGVRMADGREIRAPVVVSAVGAVNTFERLVAPEHAPPGVRAAVSAVGPSVSYVSLYLGFRDTDEALGLTGTNLWLYPGRDHDAAFERYCADPEAPFPLVFVSFPSAKDPTFRERHPGRSTVDVIVPALHAWFSPWEATRWRKRGEDYEALKARFTARILDVLLARLPQLRGKIDHAELSTPLSTAHFAGYSRGELYGIDHTPARYHMPLRIRTPVGGLYLTGQDIISAGVSAALMAGVLTSSAIVGPTALVAAFRGERARG